MVPHTLGYFWIPITKVVCTVEHSFGILSTKVLNSLGHLVNVTEFGILLTTIYVLETANKPGICIATH